MCSTGRSLCSQRRGRHRGPHATAVLTALGLDTSSGGRSTGRAARNGDGPTPRLPCPREPGLSGQKGGRGMRSRSAERLPSSERTTNPAVRCKAPETVTAGGVQPHSEPSVPRDSRASGRKGLLQVWGGATRGEPSTGWRPEGQGPPSAKAVGASLQGSCCPKWDSVHIKRDHDNNVLKGAKHV